MALLRHGNLFDYLNPGDTVLVTSNGIVTKEKRLVMGAGIAKTIRDMFTDSDLIFGRYVEKHAGVYGLSAPVSYRWKDGYVNIVLYQTKLGFKGRAKLSIIDKSKDDLLAYIATYPYGVYHLPYPGIGCGGLDPEDVAPIIRQLPDRVVVYKLK